ncbi:hypothetical protein CDAR_466341 [Caerostris darwini]|uniref:Ig-like domain-containing protein n=1 Tax=Caerostris darwini TaxID=1538125 RepID=A0AAV4WRT5_9ARAC|nr:hypothetical protein CDAR_466341 [Caerostris darwini]
MVNKPMPCHAHYASQELKQSSQTANSPFATNAPPVWVIKPSDQSALEGISVTFDCQAEGQPRPVVRWKFGKATLNNISEDGFKDHSLFL